MFNRFQNTCNLNMHKNYCTYIIIQYITNECFIALMLRGAAFCKFGTSFICMIHGYIHGYIYMPPFSIKYYLTRSYRMCKIKIINNFKLYY